MHSVLEAVLKGLISGTVSGFAKAATSSKSEKQARRVGDEVAALNRKIELEKSEIQSNLHKNAKKELLTAISYYNEGLAFLYEALDSIKTSPEENLPLDTRLGVHQEENLEVVLQSFTGVLKQVNKFKWHDLDESIIRCLSNAKKRFLDTRKKTTKAFNNEILLPEERVMAMRYRVLATILESIDHPRDAIPACKACLEELHSLSCVMTKFENFQGQVHHLNRIICELTKSFGRRGALLSWPCVDVKGKKVDPRMLLCGITSWSFGQEGKDGTQKLQHAWDITSNSLGEFIIADSVDHSVKVFNSRGRFLHRLTPFTDESRSESQDLMISEIRSVATDKDDSIYILGQEKNISEYPTAVSKVLVYSKSNDFGYSFFLLDEFRGSAMAVDSSHLAFITGGEFTKFHKNNIVHVYENDGKYVQSFGRGIIEHALGICAADDGQVLVLDRGAGVLVFSNGVPLRQFKVMTANFGAIAFHPVNQNVFVASASKTGPHIVVYSKDGKVERKIAFKERPGVPIITGMSVTSQGRIAVTAKDLIFFS